LIVALLSRRDKTTWIANDCKIASSDCTLELSSSNPYKKLEIKLKNRPISALKELELELMAPKDFFSSVKLTLFGLTIAHVPEEIKIENNVAKFGLPICTESIMRWRLHFEAVHEGHLFKTNLDFEVSK
jgi:hypothetical protein